MLDLNGTSFTNSSTLSRQHLVQVSAQGDHIVFTHTHRQTVALAVMKAAKMNILITARRLVGSSKPVLHHVPCRISCILPGKTCWQTSYAASGCVTVFLLPTGPGHPHRTLCDNS